MRFRFPLRAPLRPLLMGSSVLTISVPPAREPEATKAHHAKDGFINPWDSWHALNGFWIPYEMIKRRLNGQANVPDTSPPTVPVRKPSFLPDRETPGLRATWLGHACFYVEFPSGLRVLFDPVFEDRCSPFSFLGPRRYTPPPCDVEQIPIIDAVVISHNHYDHLSHPTVKAIAAKHPDCHFFAPLGNKKWFVEAGIHKVTELDWWDERDVSLSTDSSPSDISARIGCLPCQHISARTPFDKAKTLWASWFVESGGKKVYFAGDTGYRSVPKELDGKDDHADEYDGLYPSCPAFKEIGQYRGPFDLGLIPIGAYDPRWVMSSMHADPHDAVNIFLQTRCARALGMHWGTWVLTEEDVLEPPRKLQAALKKMAVPETDFTICDIGESLSF